jgi:hypothetical protein
MGLTCSIQGEFSLAWMVQAVEAVGFNSAYGGY